jgi:uncharacterized membrane protein YdbT with pleckstrin-like domain
METPTPYGFDLDPGETINRVIHRHPITLIPAVLSSVGLFLLSLLLIYGEARMPSVIPFPPLLAFALVGIILALSVIFLLVGIFVFRRNVLIFTNVHLVQANQFGLFTHRVSQISFMRIQDVTGGRKGLLQALFNYGDVEIQSAGEDEKFIFSKAPNPQDIADDALEIHEACLRATGKSEPE